MSRGNQAFKQTDVAKALKAARMAGVAIDRYEIDNGKIVVFVGKAPENTDDVPRKDPGANEWDAV